MCADRTITWADVRDVDPATVAALIAEHVDRALARATEAWMRDWAVFRGMEAGLAAAARGQRPKDATAPLPGPAVRIARHVVHEAASNDGLRVFPTIRALELAGLIELSPDDDYVLCMMAGLGQHPWGSSESNLLPVRWVTDDPELFERAIWRVFEVEGGGQVSMTNVERYGGQWLASFLTWVETGDVDRQRLLDACLRTLGLDFSAYRSQWYRDLLVALKPSASELASRQLALRRLLASDVPATVGYAVRALSVVQKHGALEAHATAAALVPAMQARAKGTALTALRLLGTIATEEPSADVVSPALEALNHHHVDVQRAATRLLGQRDPVLLRQHAEVLAPSLRRELGLDQPPPESHLAPSQTPGAGSPEPVGQLPERRELAPVGNDLLERLAALMETTDDALEVELVLDAVARSGDGTSLRPLRARAQSLISRGPGDWGGMNPLNLALASLVVSATGGETKTSTTGPPLVAFLNRRLAHLRSVLTGAAPPGPLLATPDDSRGFVSGQALVARLGKRGEDVDDADLVAALLRIAPEERDRALDALERTSVESEIRAVVAHALGGPVSTPPDLGRRTRRWWVAASRARGPLVEDPVLVARRLGGPGQGRPLRTGLSVAYRDRRGDPSWQVSTGATDRRFPGGRASPDALMPTYVPEPEPSPPWSGDVLGAWHRWTALIWPHDAEHFMTQAIVVVLGGMQAPVGARWVDTVDVLEAISRHAGRLGSLSYATLGSGLSHGPQEDRLLACDVVVDLVASGRLNAASLASGMVAVSDVATLTRWSEALGRVADAGHGPFVVATLTSLLPQLATDRHGLHALLALLHEESIRTSSRVANSDLREWLSTFTGSSKSARSAAALLRL